MNNKVKILIIDDDKGICDGLRDHLELEGYLVTTAYTSRNGIEHLKGAFFNIVLLDKRLPDSDGMIVLESIKEISPDTEVILLTAYASTGSIIKAMDKDVFSYLSKPFKISELITTIKKACEKQYMLFENRKLFQKIVEGKKDWENTFDSISDLISIYDKDFTLTKCNSAFINKINAKYENIIGKKCNEIFCDRNNPCPTCIFERCKETLKSEIEDRDFMGGIYTFSCFPRLDEEGEFIGVVHVARDITEHKQAEEVIKQNAKILRKALNGIINALTITVEARDPYTAGHQQRVTKLALLMAKEMGFSEERIEGLRMAGIIHDIGKISIPSEILSKPGKISETEFSLIKIHPQVGFDILKGIEFPWPVAQIVCQHHERVNGSGYPSGLSGDEILLEAKILCVADVVEAISTHRPYRPSLGIDKAIEIISESRGILYDSEVVDTCLKIIKEEEFKFE